MIASRRLASATALVFLVASGYAGAQPSASSDDEPRRIFGIIPNYRTSPTLRDYQPLPASGKFKVAIDDSLDRGTFVLAALFAAEGQLTAAELSFGHGLPGYARYYSASLTDLIVGDFMTEAIYPVILRQDPRYFRRAEGSGWQRLGYAAGQLVLTHADSGATRFNASEVLGNATAVAVSNVYYRDGRTRSANLSKLAVQLAVDMAANIVKEFAPDLARTSRREKTK